MSLFGTSSLFGQSTAQNQNQGQNQQATGGGGLFGSNTQNQQGGTAGGGGGGGGLFGQSTAQSGGGGGLFGNAQNQQNQNQQHGQQQSSGTGLFGSGTNMSGTTLAGGSSVFGQPQQQQQQQQGGGGLFGASTAQQPARPSLFASTTNQAQPQQQQQQHNSASVLGGGSLFASQAPQNGQSTTQQPAGAYFDSLFAKSQKSGETKSNMEDLPTLELGLGDLRHRLRKLQSKPNERPLEGKAHYLLAGAGVDPGAAAKDLGFLDAQGGRPERTAQGYAPSEIDVETYLSNLQTKTTLSMIADGLERSVRDFDNFLEDNVTMEWDAQRKRIYQHFGIAPREDAPGASKESQGAFGRSRRSKGPQGASKGRSTFGRSTMQKSVLGAPSKVGMHEPEFADVERAGADGSPAAGTRSGLSDKVSRERQSQLSNKVSELNLHRLHKRPYPILAELGELEKKSAEAHAPHVVEAYRAMVEIVGEDPEAETTINNATAKEREFAAKYLDENPNSQQSVEMRKRILEGSTRFLEKQFLREVESLIAKHPHEARLGGLPDVTSKIRAYIRLRAARKDLAPDTTILQDHNGEHVWAVVFYLLRSGHIREAAEYVESNQSIFKSLDRTFATYLNNYYKSGDARIIPNPKLRDRCVAEYIGRTRHNDQPEPYRMACYKIIGRADLGNRNLEGLNTDINDWIWLQFNLAREGDKTIEMAGDSFGLAELQSSIREIGLKHFPKANSEDSNGSFGMFFYLQVLSGMFEDAISYLYPFAYVDAVHFGLALTYYGLLRPSDALAGGNDLRSYSTKQLPQINFGRMIGYYTRDFRAADVVSAVDYLTLIALNQDLGGEAGHRHATLCHEALRELVLETREFSKLIGDIRPDGRRIRGVIEERGVLIGLDDEANFVNTVTLQAASFADDNGRTTDSVLLYHLAGEYDTVVAIVSRALSEAISLEIGEDPMRLMPVKPRAAAGTDQEAPAGSSLSLAAIDDPVELAKTMMSMYEKDAMFYRRIQDENKVACRVLLEMSTIKSLVEGGQWATCIDKIRGLEILPLDASGDASTIRAYAAKFTSLSQPVSINVPNLLMWTVVACVRQREQLVAGGQYSGNEGTRRMLLDQLRQITLDLTTYTSQLKYRFPPHLHEALARASAD